MPKPVIIHLARNTLSIFSACGITYQELTSSLDLVNCANCKKTKMYKIILKHLDDDATGTK